MKISDIKPIILELITETLFGKKFILDFGDDAGEEPEPYQVKAVISPNMRGRTSDFPYRISLFRGEGEMLEADGHIAITKRELEYILSNKQLPRRLELWVLEIYGETPTIKGPINEAMPKGFDLIIGIISMDAADIEAIKGGRFTSHKNLSTRQGYPWRYNELSDNLYWREQLPPDKHREKVKAWLEDRGYKIRHEIDLDNLPQGEYYTEMWNDAHGI